MRTLRSTALLGLTSLLLGAGISAAPLVAQTPAPHPAPTPTPVAATAPVPTPDPTRVIPPKLDYDSLAFARQMIDWFYGGQIDSLWAHTHPMMQQQMGTKEKYSEMFAQFLQHAGSETDVVSERWVKRNGKRQYWRTIHATEFTDQPLMIRWVLEPGKLVGGMGLNPESQAPAVDPN